MIDDPVYTPRRPARSEWAAVRGLRLHLNAWGDASLVTPERPPLLMLHGWMDVGASFQFVVDALAEERFVLAPDFRGFGLSEAPAADSYWFPDYLADLDGLLDQRVEARWPGLPVDLLGHSMGANVAMLYAGVRPARIRRLINLEGFGLPESKPAQAPGHYAKWLDELKAPARMRDYDSLAGVAARLRKNDPLLRADRAAWLASHWSAALADGSGRRRLLADAAHKRANPVLYRKEEALECWKRISAPVLWVEGDRTGVMRRWNEGYPAGEIDRRLAVVPQVRKERLAPAGHMLHHDQPEALAGLIEAFLEADGPGR